MRLVWGSVVSDAGSSRDAQSLRVTLDDGTEGRAVCYPALCGPCEVGERVLLNTTAVDLALGTGGLHFVVAHGDAQGVAFESSSGGHIMKLRYSPLQLDVLSVESQESPHHETMRTATSLSGMPVVCCGLHSQVPLVAAAVKQADPNLKVAYCMSDQSALALPLSDVARASVREGLLDTTISCGQAFGGAFEAVNLHSGLLAARHVARADVAIVAIGPGVVGTATPYGHGGIAQGEALNAVSALGGTPIAVLRLSFADARPRHRVVSHHSLAALMHIALAPARIPVPSLPEEYAEQVEAALDNEGVWGRHVRADAASGRVPAPDLRGIRVTTMGRDSAQDPAFFAAAYAAGEVAARLAHDRDAR